ncbi:MAG: type IV pilus assembly protein PilM, partial [Candidatus Firestonebacteria bacterium]
IRYDAEQYIPFNIAEVVLDFSILGETVEDGQKKIDVLLVAVKEEVVNQYITMLKDIGIDVGIIDVDCFALQNCYEANYGKKEDEAVALLNIGARYTNLNIIEGGITRFSRDIPIGGVTLTKDIAREFAVSFTEAEKLKREQGAIIIESEEVRLTRIPSKEDNRIKIYSAIVTSLGKLVMEVRRAFDFYESGSKKKAINKICLSGGTAKLKNIEKFFGERMKVPVELFDAFAGLEQEDPSMMELKIKENGIFAPVSIGLSCRRSK